MEQDDLMEFLYKYGWLTLMIAMAGDLLVSFILSFFYKGYSSKKMSISALGNPNSPVRLPFNIWMIVEGLLFLAAIPAVFNYYAQVSKGLTITSVTFIAVFAVGACIFTGFFSVNESKEEVTTASKIHGAGSVIGFMLFLFVPLLMAIMSFKDAEGTLGIISVVSFAISIVFFALFVMSDKDEFKDTAVNNEGLWQRLNLFFMYCPLAVIAVKRLMGM